MSERKYIKDYRLIHIVDEKGRLSSRAEYQGDYFVFQGSDEEARGGGGKVCILSAAAWICFVAPLLINNGAMRLFWISLPYVFTAIPLWKLTGTGLQLRKAGDRFTRKESDAFSDIFPAAGLWGMILQAAALAGTAVTAVFAPAILMKTDILFAACCICTAFLCGLCFSMRKLFRTEKL